MKKMTLISALLAVFVLTWAATDDKESTSELTKNFITGNPEIASINQMSFGPEGLLFLGDSKKAAVYALNTKDVKATSETPEINIKEIGKASGRGRG